MLGERRMIGLRYLFEKRSESTKLSLQEKLDADRISKKGNLRFRKNKVRTLIALTGPYIGGGRRVKGKTTS